MKRTAHAHWNGTLMEGKGELTTQSTTLNNTQYSFKTRFADGIGTNPEESIAAAHAGCFTMAVGAALSQAGVTPVYLKKNLRRSPKGRRLIALYQKHSACPLR